MNHCACPMQDMVHLAGCRTGAAAVASDTLDAPIIVSEGLRVGRQSLPRRLRRWIVSREPSPT